MLVTNGVYSLTSEIVLSDALTIRSVEGPEGTINACAAAGAPVEIDEPEIAAWSCSPELVAGVRGNITDDPLFRDGDDIRRMCLFIIRFVANDASGDSAPDSTENGTLGSTQGPANNSAPAGSDKGASFRPVKLVPCGASRQPGYRECCDKNNDSCAIFAAHSILLLVPDVGLLHAAIMDPLPLQSDGV